MLTKTEGRRHNSVLPQLAVTCKIKAECSYQTLVQVVSEVLRNRQLRQHAKRYAQAEKRQRHSKLTMKMEY